MSELAGSGESSSWEHGASGGEAWSSVEQVPTETGADEEAGQQPEESLPNDALYNDLEPLEYDSGDHASGQTDTAGGSRGSIEYGLEDDLEPLEYGEPQQTSDRIEGEESEGPLGTGWLDDQEFEPVEYQLVYAEGPARTSSPAGEAGVSQELTTSDSSDGTEPQGTSVADDSGEPSTQEPEIAAGTRLGADVKASDDEPTPDDQSRGREIQGEPPREYSERETGAEAEAADQMEGVQVDEREAADRAFEYLAELRRLDGVPGVDEPDGKRYTRARLDMQGQSFDGRNGPEETWPRPPGVTYQTMRHAEGDAMAKAKRAGSVGGDATLYVDRTPCGFCRSSLMGLARWLEVNQLRVVTPGGVYGEYKP